MGNNLNGACQKILPSNGHTCYCMLCSCTLSVDMHSRMVKLLAFSLVSVMHIFRFLGVPSESNKVFVYSSILIFTNLTLESQSRYSGKYHKVMKSSLGRRYISLQE